VDLSLPGLFLAQTVENPTYATTLALLHKYQPDVILLCDSERASRAAAVSCLVKAAFGGARFVAVARGNFDDTRGRAMVRGASRFGPRPRLAATWRSPAVYPPATIFHTQAG
jgi:hypothetical protein